MTPSSTANTVSPTVVSDFGTDATKEKQAVKQTLKELTAKQKEAIAKYGDTPVIYWPTKAMMRPLADPGLSTLIENAMTITEVKNLLKKGDTYKGASPKTKRKWQKVADKRMKELSK